MASDESDAPPGLARALAEAARRWEGVRLQEETAAAYVRERLDPGAPAETVDVADLYLACACVGGDRRALAYLEEMIATAMKPAMAVVAEDDDRQEVQQRLRERLLVDRPERPARLRSYRGSGPLRKWLRVCLTREAIGMRRREGPPGEPEDLDRVAEAAADPELALLKANAAEVFRVAFTESLASLTPRERTVLRHQVIGQLTFDEIGRMYGVHKATITRWLQKARQALLLRTRERMFTELKVGREEFEQLFGLIRSNLDLSISRHLPKDET